MGVFTQTLPSGIAFRIPSGMLVFYVFCVTILLLCYYRGLTHTTKWPGKHEWPQSHHNNLIFLPDFLPDCCYTTLLQLGMNSRTWCYFNWGWLLVTSTCYTMLLQVRDVGVDLLDAACSSLRVLTQGPWVKDEPWWICLCRTKDEWDGDVNISKQH